MMKKLLALLIAFVLIIPANTAFVFAGDLSANVLFSEDFADYDENGVLPSGWTWATLPDTSVVDTNPEDFGDGHGTAMRIYSEGKDLAYMKASIPSIDMTKGVAKLSFQAYFDGVGQTAGASQQIHIYLGTASPLVKGLRVANGVVYYASSASERWTHKPSTASVFPKTWYTFDVINDFDNNRAYYFVDGKPIYDQATGELVVTECYNLGTAATVSDLYVLARSKHTDAEYGGDIIIDNITVTSSGAGGVYTNLGTEIQELPSSVDVKFTTGINPENFNRDEITVKKYSAEDVLMQNGEDVPFSLEAMTNAGCTVDISQVGDIADFEKIKIDFGANTDCMGKKLSYTYFVKVPEKEDAQSYEVMYDSETDEDYGVELVPHRTDISTYDYEENGSEKSAIKFSTQTGSSPAPTVRISRKDSKNLIEEGYEYHLTYRTKILDGTKNVAGSEYNYKLAGEFDSKKDESGTKLYNSGSTQLFYMTNNGLNGFYREDEAKIVKFGFTYKFNSDSTITGDTDSLFANQKWLDYDVYIYPDTKSWSFTFKDESGNKEQRQNVPVSFWDTTFASRYSAKYPSTNMDIVSGELKTLRFFMSSPASNIIIDNLRLERREITEESATVKYVALKDEDGTLMNFSDGIVEPGAKEMVIAFDGTIDGETADGIFLDGENIPSYSGEFDAVNKLYTITFDEIMGGSADYTVNFPEVLNLNYGITSVPFSTSAGEIAVSAPVININNSAAYADVFVRNTSFEPNAPATVVIAAYKNGAVTDMATTGLSASPCSSGSTATNEISIDGADTVKAFVIDNATVCHIADYEVKTLSKSQGNTERTYEITGNTSSEYVTALLMTPSEEDKKVSNTFENLSEENAFSYIDVITAKDGEYSFGFDIDGKSGKYTLYVADKNGDILEEKAIYYSDVNERKAAQELVAEAAQEDTDDEMYQVLCDYATELGFSGEKVFENADMEYIAKKMYTYVKQKGIDTDYENAVRNIAGDICLEKALEDGTVQDIAMYEKTAGVFETEPVKTWYGKNIADTSKITDRLNGKDIYDLSAQLMEAVALEVISQGRGYSYVKDLCVLLEDEIGIDVSEGNNSVYRAMDGKDYEDYDALASDFEKYADKYDNGSSGSGGGSGGGSRGGSSGSSIGNVAIGGVENTPAPEPLKEYVFNDISDYRWAADSITELYEKNIVSGRGDGSFAPGDAVLREEFVKMIVEAFGIKGSSEAVFEDVKDTDWFKPYVYTAFGAGIVSGEGTTFGAGKSITRQDMAKIICNALSASGVKLEKADISKLADSDKIASYALDSVACLYGAGVINGKSSDSFAPLDNATRAETAVIISRALALVK